MEVTEELREPSIYLRCYGVFPNLHELFKLCSRKLWLFLDLTNLRITMIMEGLKKLFFEKITDTTMEACNLNFLSRRNVPPV